MTKKMVFISHAGPDSPAALEIADELRQFGLEVEIDREKLRSGDSFLSFMESALSSCDYCLLLWSEAASERKYVKLEWEVALYKTIEESRRFLLIGRLQDFPVPALLGPRLRVELFPEPGPGLAELRALFEEDLRAEESSARPVKLAEIPAPEDAEGDTVYVTSQLFGRTLPVQWDLRVPCGVQLDRFVDAMELPRKEESHGVVGVRFDYDFGLGEAVLSRSEPLADQGVAPQSVLWLRTTVTPFAAVDPIGGELQSATFRGANDPVQEGRMALLDAVNRAGLGL